jgi:general secretion pathway protein K
MQSNLIEVLAAEEKIAREAAERIIGWRTPPKRNAANEEEALYAASGLVYSPRQSPFAHIYELSLVLGIPAELVERALPFMTVFSGSPDVDVLIAPPEIIAALPGMTPAALTDFLNQRTGLPRDQSAVAAALGLARTKAPIPQSRSFRILTSLRFDNGRRTSSELVIALGDAKEPYRVLSWQDDVDAGRRSRRLAGG